MAYHKSIHGVGGRVYFVPSGTNASKVSLAVIKNWTFELSQESSDLQGSGLDLLDTLPIKRSLKGKLSLSDFSSSIIAAVTSGTTISAGVKLGTTYQTTVPSTPFQVTPTPPGSGTFYKDLGVVDLDAKKEMTCAATATGTGVYAVNESTGQYTFNTADATHNVLISYSYSVAGSGQTLEIASASAGVASSTYALHFYGSAGGKSYGIYIPACRLPNLSLTMAPDAWSDVSVDYTAFLDGSNKLAYTYLPE